jgi:hypothetical protein|tara:strand:- start:231 stop:437 length:207 start_codon:yes stop_codon:yes gene_type:complete
MKLEEWRKTKGIRYSELAKLLELTIKNPIAKLRGYCVGTNIPREKEMMQKIFKLTKRKVSANDFYDLK